MDTGDIMHQAPLPPLTRVYWQRHTHRLLADISTWASSAADISEARHPFSFYLPDIASWECPRMERSIQRDEHGEISEIRYSISSHQVLSLVAEIPGDTNHAPIRPFFTNFKSGFRLSPEADTMVAIHLLLDMWPDFYAEHTAGAADEAKHRLEIKTQVDNALADLPLPHSLDQRGDRPSLLVRLGPNAVLEAQLPLTQGNLLGHAPREWIEQVAKTWQRSKLPFTIRGKDPFTVWGRHQRMLPDFVARMSFRHQYEEQWRTAAKGILDRPPAMAANSLEDMLTWEIPGLRLEGTKNALGRVERIDALIGQRNVLWLKEGSLRLLALAQYTEWLELQWDWNSNLHGLLMAFPSLVERMMAVFAHEASKEAKIIKMAQDGILRIVAQEVEASGHTYMHKLLDTVSLQVKMLRRRALRFDLTYEDSLHFIAHLGETVRLVDTLMEEVRYPFWIITDTECQQRHPSAYAKLPSK